MLFLKRLKSRISFKLLGSVLLVILILAIVLTAIAFYFIRSSYLEFYSSNALLTNRLVASQISGEQLKPYIERLIDDPVLYAQQRGYADTNALLFDLQIQGESGMRTQEYTIGKMQQEAFKKQMQRFKDETYEEIQTNLNDLREASGARFLYIFADTGVPDCYTFIFDAATTDEKDDIDRDDYGTVYYKDEFIGAEEVFETGRQMRNATYENSDVYGTLYYAYAPILDSDGATVALVGTDIDLSGMEHQLSTILLVNVAAVLLISLLTVLLLFFLLRRIIVSPLQTLTTASERTAHGDLSATIPPAIRSRSDEIGRLGNAFSEQIDVSRRLIDNTQEIFHSVRLGRLEARTNPKNFEGSFAIITTQINETLEVIAGYFDSIPEALCIVNTQLQLVYRNRHYLEVFHHLKAEDLVRRSLAAEPSAGSAELCAELSRRADRDPHIATLSLDTPDGQPRSYSILAKKLVTEHHVTGALLIASDITDYMQATRRAESANRAKSEFLSRASHELRTPLNVIQGLTKLALRSPDLDAKNRATYENITNASEHLLGIISDVLDMSRMEAGKLSVHPENMDLHALFMGCYEMMSVTARERDVTLTRRWDLAIPDVLVGDPGRIRQILLNLLSNAVKFTPAGGSVAMECKLLRLADSNAWISLSVTDTGIGISSAFIEKVFQPFEQEEQYLQRKFTGNGLGLSISRNLAQLMGGSLSVQSELGNGSVFTLELPLPLGDGLAKDAKGIVDISADDATNESLEGLHMLLVDDIEINRSIIIELFEESGMVIDEAADGLDAMRKYAASTEDYYDILLMDIQMPRMNGYEATEQIRAMQRADAKTVPIVAMTANALKEDVERAHEAGMTDHLAKPIDFALCEQMIRKYTHR